MWVRFQGSALRTALSITTAACSFVLTAARCPAGEKIDFSTPSNPALAQLPAAVVREDDDTDSLLKMPGNGNGMQGRRYVVPPVTTTTIMVAPRDRRKTDDLRAWDSVLTPPTLADQDEAFNANLKPKPANPFTNSYDATSQWDLTPSTLKQTQTLGLSTLSPMDDSARHGWNAHNWESHGNDLSPFKEFSHEDQSADSVNPTAWTSAVKSSFLGYSQRLHNSSSYKSDYASSVSDPSTAGVYSTGDPYAKSPTPGVGDSSTAVLDGSSDSFMSRRGPTGLDMSASALRSTDNDQIHRYGYVPPVQSPVENTRRILGAAQPGYGSGQVVAQPAVLPFPKKPGSLFH